MKHAHNDLIIAWLENNNLEFQVELISMKNAWEDGSIHDVISNPNRNCRIKPREFIKGHWYPCVDKNTGRGSIKRFNGRFFFDETQDYHHEDKKCHQESDFCFVGESLGEISFK